MLLASGFLQGFWMLAAVTRGAMTAELVPTSLLGRWYGILHMFKGLVGILSPIIGGIIWQTIGPAHVLFFMISTQLFSMVLLSTVPETQHMLKVPKTTESAR